MSLPLANVRIDQSNADIGRQIKGHHLRSSFSNLGLRTVDFYCTTGCLTTKKRLRAERKCLGLRDFHRKGRCTGKSLHILAKVGPEAVGDQPAWSGDYAAGDMLGEKYEVLEVIGRGSSGVTYKAKATQLGGKEVAVKALSLRRMTGWKQLELFEREAKTLQSLNHSGIPRYVDYFEEDTEKDRGFFLVQELAPGKSLTQLIESGWRADDKEAKRIAIEILKILEYLGSRRPPVVHRDVKPHNVVLEGGKLGGHVSIVDFGGVQAAAASDTLGVASTIVGTYGYMAPEQFRGAAQPASDLYGLGGTLLYLLSGKPPNAFPQERMQIAFKQELNMTAEMAIVLEGLLDPHVEDRMTAADAKSILSGSNELSRVPDAIPGGRAKIQLRRNKLQIDIPPGSISQDKLALGGFAVTWNVSIGVWTASALAAGSLGAAAFSLPFWAAGFSIARDAFGSSLREERLTISPEEWSIRRRQSVFRQRFSDNHKAKLKGWTKDLQGARVVPLHVVNGVTATVICLREGFREHKFGAGLSFEEQHWVVDNITKYLRNLSGSLASGRLPAPRPVQLKQPDDERRLEREDASWGPAWDPGNSPFEEVLDQDSQSSQAEPLDMKNGKFPESEHEAGVVVPWDLTDNGSATLPSDSLGLGLFNPEDNSSC